MNKFNSTRTFFTAGSAFKYVNGERVPVESIPITDTCKYGFNCDGTLTLPNFDAQDNVIGSKTLKIINGVLTIV